LVHRYAKFSIANIVTPRWRGGAVTSARACMDRLRCYNTKQLIRWM